MFDRTFLKDAIERSTTTNQLDRRRFLAAAGLTGVGVGAATLMGPASSALAEEASAITDEAVLNFALNLEYLEAEFYLRAVRGVGLNPNATTGVGDRGQVTGGHKVRFVTTAIKNYATEIAFDEQAHVYFLRETLGSARVARPTINLREAFTAAALAAGLIQPGETFNAFANETNFLIAAFIFEDVGVTAYKGAAPLLVNKTYLEAAAGLLAVEAYHASNIRTVMASNGLESQSVAISDARDSLDGPEDKDQGLLYSGKPINIVPTDMNGLAFSRTTGEVLNIVYLNPASVTSGGFFPDGVNGVINTSDPNA